MCRVGSRGLRWMPCCYYVGEMGLMSAYASSCTRLGRSRSSWLFDEGSFEGLSYDCIYLLMLAKKKKPEY